VSFEVGEVFSVDRSLNLLVIDDDAGEVSLLRTLLAEMRLSHKCYHCSTGAEALDYLHRKSPFEDAPRPHLILLDLDMPGMGGCEVLSRIKSDTETRSIPVVMLSSSLSNENVEACYMAHANAYIRKPTDLAGNVAMLRHLDQFWKYCELVLA
jgi:two-component system response regulator